MSIQPSKDPIICTDHACLRYLERVMELDVEMVRQHILGICATGAAYGAVCVRAEGFRFEIVENRIVTVVKDHVMPSRLTRKRNQERMRAEG
jgi:hypothetical protein